MREQEPNRRAAVFERRQDVVEDQIIPCGVLSELCVEGPGRRLSRNTVIESTFEVGRRFRCTMRIDCSQLHPGAVIRAVPGDWQPHMPAQLAISATFAWQSPIEALPDGYFPVERFVDVELIMSSRTSRIALLRPLPFVDRNDVPLWSFHR